jgi:hypothetical protein
VKVDAFNEIKSLFTVGIDVVNNSFVYVIEESVEYDDVSDMDVTTVEVECINISVVVTVEVNTVVPLLDIGGDDEDKKYSVGVDFESVRANVCV